MSPPAARGRRPCTSSRRRRAGRDDGRALCAVQVPFGALGGGGGGERRQRRGAVGELEAKPRPLVVRLDESGDVLGRRLQRHRRDASARAAAPTRRPAARRTGRRRPAAARTRTRPRGAATAPTPTAPMSLAAGARAPPSRPPRTRRSRWGPTALSLAAPTPFPHHAERARRRVGVAHDFGGVGDGRRGKHDPKHGVRHRALLQLGCIQLLQRVLAVVKGFRPKLPSHLPRRILGALLSLLFLGVVQEPAKLAYRKWAQLERREARLAPQLLRLASWDRKA